MLAILLVPPSVADPIPPLPPQNFQATRDVINGTVLLSWAAPDDDSAYTYDLYRGTTYLGNIADLSYLDTGASNLTMIYSIQTVRVVNGVAESSVQQYSAPIVAVAWIIVHCEPIGIWITSQPPFVIVGMRGDCF